MDAVNIPRYRSAEIDFMRMTRDSPFFTATCNFA
jgi:hypothetical protein